MKLKNIKSHVIENISNELIKYGGPEIAEQILKLLQKTLKHGKIPN